jgi:hypothetical protein
MVLIALFMLMIIREPEAVQKDIETEMHHTIDYLSVQEQVSLENRTKIRFRSWLYDSGLYQAVYGAIAPSTQKNYAVEWQKNASLGIISEGWIFKLLQNFQLYFYQFAHRATLLEFWFLSTLPMVVAIVTTGYYSWRIKAYQLISQSTSSVRIWLKVLWIVLFMFLGYLITPNIFGAYTIFAPPVLLFIVALSVSYVISNFAKSS